MRNIIILAGLMLLITFSSASGQEKYNLPPLSSYPEGTISLANFQKIDVKNLRIKGDSIHYRYNQQTIDLHLEEVNYIRVTEGNRAKRGAWIGGVSMLVISLVSILNVEADPNYELRDNAFGITVGLTAAGAGIGALIGLGIKKRRSYYVHFSN